MSANDVLIKQFSSLCSFLGKKTLDMISNYKINKYKYYVKLNGKVTSDGYNGYRYTFSNNFRGILYHIRTNVTQFKGLNHVVENIFSTSNKYNGNSRDTRHDGEYMCDNGSFEIDKDIVLEINMNETSDGNDTTSKHSTKNIIIYLKSNHKNISQIMEFINQMRYTYENENNITRITNILYFSLHKYDEQFASEKFVEYVFTSNTTFDNIFFDQKESFMKQYKFFVENEQFYKDKGIPYRLGILLHGQPGCGKTSLVKAIANATKRHIMSINMSKLEKLSSLENVFFNKKIGGLERYIPINKRIYLISEFDVSDNDILKTRKIDYEGTKEYEKIEVCDKGKFPKKFKYKDNEEITLGNFLEMLDGCMECHGRVIIFTTNNIDDIDPALLRPGRIDINIKFDKCSIQNIKDLTKHFFNIDVSDETIERKFGDKQHSHADIVNTFKKHFLNPQDIYK